MKGNRDGAPIPESLSTKLNRLSETAKQYPAFQFRTLAHLISAEMLTWACHELKRKAAAGVDGVTMETYEQHLVENIGDLHTRLRERRYRAQPLRRVYMEKEDGKKRPLSIPALEDKIVQGAVVEILTRIYEVDFLPCSYGYRPNRSAHDAVNALREKITLGKVSYVYEADIRDYFGSIVREKLKEMLTKRIADKDVLRLIGKWLRVGVIEDGKLLMSEDGTYQGSVISPLLANVYLHEVLDLWVERDVKPRMRGEITLYRYADDFVVCFQYRDDAERFQRVIPKRFAKYGLKLHEKKTKLLSFGRFAEQESRKKGRKPETFNFLGFTFICGCTQNGRFRVKLRTMTKRKTRFLRGVTDWCRNHRHWPTMHQWKHLTARLRGHYVYYGLYTNVGNLGSVRYEVAKTWRKWLSRRHRGKPMAWDRFNALLKKYPLPEPRLGTKWTQLVLIGEFA